VIVDRGERKVIRKLANNASARFSDAGYSSIVARADADDELTEILGLRIDLPIEFLRDLLSTGDERCTRPAGGDRTARTQEEIRRILKTIAGAAGEDTPPARDFSRGRSIDQVVEPAQRTGRRGYHQVRWRQEVEEVAASLAVLNNVSTEMMARLLEGPGPTLSLFRANQPD